MPTAINKIVDGFPFPTISPIIGSPNYETISEVHLKLNSNSASVQSNLGCGTLGLLQLIVSPAVYATFSATAFIVPVNPGAKLTILSIVLGPHITNLRYAHDVATAVFNKYDQTNKALRQMLISAVKKYSSVPSATSTWATAPPQPTPYWNIFTQPTKTFLPPTCRTTTPNFERHTTPTCLLRH